MSVALSQHANLRLVALGFTALLVIALLSGCGRKGPLEPPPGSVVNQEVSESSNGDSQTNTETQDRTFILDGLI